MDRLDITPPDDWHAHFRDGALLRLALPHTARACRRAIAMPNLDPPVVTTAQCRLYRERLLAAAGGRPFEPLMTLYLTDETPRAEIAEAKPDPDCYDAVYGVKLYPRDATTNAASGVRDIDGRAPVFEEMEKRGLPLLVHGECVAPDIDVYDRECVFIERALEPLRRRFPQLKIVFEHITTREAVDYVRATPGVGATITPHHLIYNRNALFEDGLRPHRHCLPVAKREDARRALVEAACSGDADFFAGTDSAPHPLSAKHAAVGCAGVFSAPCAIETYAEIFEQAGALDRLDAFAGRNGAAFYGVAPNAGAVRLARAPWRVPERIEHAGETVVPFRAGETVAWQLADVG